MRLLGDLEQEVAPKENSCCKSELLAGDRQLPIHCQSCESQVDSVDEGKHKKYKQEWQQPDPELPDRHRLDGVRNNPRGACHTYLPIVLQLNSDCRHDNGLRLTKTLTGK